MGDDDDGDNDPVFVEARYQLNDDDIRYSRRMIPGPPAAGKYDLANLDGYANEPLVNGVGALRFEFARYEADGTYNYHASGVTGGWGLDDWGRVTAVRTQVTFVDVDPWGDGIADKQLSFTVAMRNQVSRWIPQSP